MENLKSLFIMHEYTVVKGYNSTWDEKSYSFFYNLYKHSYLNGVPSNSSSTLGNVSSAQEEFFTQFKEDLFKFIVEGIGITIVTTLGILGNMLSIVVLAKKKMKSKSINRLLLGLAVTDTIFIATVLYAIGIPNICAYLQIDFTRSLWIIPITYPLGISAHTGSVYFTVAVTAERWLVVVHPFRARIKCTPRRAVYIAVAVSAFSFLYNVPRWWEYSYTAILNEDGQPVRYLPLTTAFRRNAIYERYYVHLSFFTFIYTIPMIVLIALNVSIYRAVKRAKSNRKFITTAEEKENSLAFMLIVVVTVFLVCNGLSLLNLIAKLTTGNPNIYELDSIRNFCLMLNSSINFIIYFAYGRKFRSMVLEMMSGCWTRTIRCCSCKRMDRDSSSAVGFWMAHSCKRQRSSSTVLNNMTILDSKASSSAKEISNICVTAI